MKIVALSQELFRQFIQSKMSDQKGIGDLKKVLMIEIIRNGDDLIAPEASLFRTLSDNVKTLYFSNVDKVQFVPMPDGKFEYLAKPISDEQAKELYTFIRDNVAGKETVVITCNIDGTCRGAVATFIHEYIGGEADSNEYYANSFIYRSLQRQWLGDNDADVNFLTNS